MGTVSYRMAMRDGQPEDTMRYVRAIHEAQLKTRSTAEEICDSTLAAHRQLSDRGADITVLDLMNFTLGRISRSAVRESTEWAAVLRPFVAGYQVAPQGGTPHPAVPASKWEYSSFADDMSSGTTYYAKIVSSNTVTFDFPYNGAQHATLSLRTHPRYGKDAILSLERGQFLCSSYDDCSVLVRFDDGEPVRYEGRGPSDQSTEHLFISPYSQLVAGLRKAKRIRIAAPVYQEGAPVFEFDVEGFSLEDYRPKN